MKVSLERYVLVDSLYGVASAKNGGQLTRFRDISKDYYHKEGYYPKLYMTPESAAKAAKQLGMGVVKKIIVTYDIDEV